MRTSPRIPVATLDDYFAGKTLSKSQQAYIEGYRTACIVNIYGLSDGILEKSYRDGYKSHPLSRILEGILINLLEAGQASELFRNQRVIELGPGMDPSAELFLSLGASSYVGVDMHKYPVTVPAGAELVQSDALRFLMSQADCSAIVVSNNVVCPELYQRFLHVGGEVLAYYRFIGKELCRITPPGKLTVHIGSYVSDPDWIELVFRRNGFVLDDIAPKGFEKEFWRKNAGTDKQKPRGF